ncbi:hypothetical protein HJB80_02845 [Rhizobium lentis]|uniref:DNA polymerase III subunit beta family protein n=1 Tax=Rhizobium lentis TaxID=1138194 RepID=UPI001C83DF83|nr:hypothetical protein [Rhizobium lentis]MBX5131630.1 hypothetical protein [Rhizobium lentis]
MKTTVDANLFRLIWTTVSKEETRYYLNGVFIEPHPEKGALLVATDGHRMLVAHDENGQCEEKIIVKLPKYALQECKHKPVHGSARILEIDHEGTGNAKISQINSGEFSDILTVYDVLIDGTFPNWRRAVPDMSDEAPGTVGVGFNAKYLKEFGALGQEITKTIDGASPAFIIQKQSGGSPTIIRWSGVRHIFGVFMPMRFDSKDLGIPTFIALPAPQQAA